MPSQIRFRYGPTGYNIVDVGMVLQLPSPGVQQAEKAGKITTDKGIIGRKLFDGCRRRLEHGAVTPSLVTADDKPQAIGNREGHHEMVPGQLALNLFFQPGLAFVVLTLRTVAVAAGLKDRVDLAAALA